MKLWKRILALVAVIIVVGMVIATFIMGITGSEYTLGMFGLTFLVVIQIFALLLIIKLVDRYHSPTEDGANSDNSQTKGQDDSDIL